MCAPTGRPAAAQPVGLPARGRRSDTGGASEGRAWGWGRGQAGDERVVRGKENTAEERMKANAASGSAMEQEVHDHRPGVWGDWKRRVSGPAHALGGEKDTVWHLGVM